jgi:hypothetical protein
MPAPALNPDDLATAISTAIPQAFQDVKKMAYTGNPQDLQPLVLAISRGLITYLEGYLQANQANLIASMSLSVGGAAAVANTVSNLALGISGV